MILKAQKYLAAQRHPNFKVVAPTTKAPPSPTMKHFATQSLPEVCPDAGLPSSNRRGGPTSCPPSEHRRHRPSSRHSLAFCQMPGIHRAHFEAEGPPTRICLHAREGQPVEKALLARMDLHSLSRPPAVVSPETPPLIKSTVISLLENQFDN